MPASSRHPLLYVLHSSKLYGTERMALATLQGLADEFEPILLGPPGPAMDRAEQLGFAAFRFNGGKQLARVLRPLLRRHASLTYVATSVVQSAVCVALNLLYRRRINHIHIVHGGVDDHGSYGRKKWLNHAGVCFITVSDWARQKLIDHGVRADRIDVVPNFLPREQIASAPRRPPYDGTPLRNVILVSRLDPLKRVDLLLDALDRKPNELRDMSFKIFGLGSEMAPLQQRAQKNHPNVHFAGRSEDIPQELCKSDLLLHTCPTEPFGLVVLEAMAANVAVLVPDHGGAAGLVEDGVNGFKFPADDPAELAKRFLEIRNARADKLNRAVANGRIAVEQTYAADKALAMYRKLFSPI